MERPHPATLAWAGIIGAVVAYDVFSPEGETLSEAVDRGLERPIGRYAALGGIVLTAAHLVNAIPRRYDVIHRVAEWARATVRMDINLDNLTD